MNRRFGRGAYYVATGAGTEDDPTFDARELFVSVAVKAVPELRPSFAESVQPWLDVVMGAYDHLLPAGRPVVLNAITTSLGLQQAWLYDGIPSPPLAADAPPGDPARELHDALAAWSSRFHMSANPWFALRVVLRATAARELRLGLYQAGASAAPELATDLWNLWVPFYSLEPLGGGPRPVLVDLTAMTESEIRSAIEAHRAEVAGSTRVRRSPAKSPGFAEHFQWLARWQLQGESYRVVADRHGVDEDRVTKAVRRTAKLVSLHRRTEAIV